MVKAIFIGVIVLYAILAIGVFLWNGKPETEPVQKKTGQAIIINYLPSLINGLEGSLDPTRK